MIYIYNLKQLYINSLEHPDEKKEKKTYSTNNQIGENRSKQKTGTYHNVHLWRDKFDYSRYDSSSFLFYSGGAAYLDIKNTYKFILRRFRAFEKKLQQKIFRFQFGVFSGGIVYGLKLTGKKAYRATNSNISKRLFTPLPHPHPHPFHTPPSHLVELLSAHHPGAVGPDE